MYNIIKINTTIFRTSVLHYTCVTIRSVGATYWWKIARKRA